MPISSNLKFLNRLHFELMSKKEEFDQLVAYQQNIVITAHTNPDEDAVCSALAVYEYIYRKWPEKNIRIVISDQTNDNWKFLANADKIEWVENLADHLEGVDLVVFLDGNSRKRFSPTPERIDLAQFKSVCIDHHPTNPDNFTLNLSDLSAVATCQIIADVLFVNDNDLDKDLVEILLIGVLGDSGNFRYFSYQNSSGLETVKRLIDVGKIEIQSLLLKTDKISETEFEIIKILVSNTTNVELSGVPNLTYSYLPRSVLKQFQDKSIISQAYHRYLYLFIRQIETHPWGFVVVPERDNEFRISFRSTPGAPNVKQLAEIFNGGGHYLAAGGKYLAKEGEEVDAKNVCEEVLKVIKAAELELVVE